MFLRSLSHLLIAGLLAGTACAATDPFAGTWKMNPSKSVLTDQMKVEAAGPNRYTLNFSGDNTETIVADGTDQPGLFGSTFSITVLGPNQWKSVRKTDGHITISAIWDLSSDGNTLTDNFTGYRADGSTSNLLYKYTRIAGTSGFVGTWQSTSEQVNSTYEIKIETYDSNGLSLINPAQKMTQNLKFDGHDYAAQGPNLPDGYACSAHRLSDRSFQMTRKIKDKVLDTQDVKVSADGKTLSMTIHIPGRTKPDVQVFDRE
jgi:hypothetical protein